MLIRIGRTDIGKARKWDSNIRLYPIGTTIVTQALTIEAAEFNRRTKALQENKKVVDALKDANNALIDSIDVRAFVADNGNISGVKDINAYTDQLHRITELERKQTFERQRQQQDLIIN